MLLSFTSWASNAYAVDDNLDIVFTTTDAGGSYGNKHIHVAWITDTSDNFVYTVGTNVGTERAVWAYARKYALTTWWGTNPEGQADIDARTGATQTAYQTYNIDWNFREKDGTDIPDGTYRLYFECTNSDSGFPRNYTYFTITKGGSAWSQGPTSQGGYNDVTITFTPGYVTAPVVENLAATQVTSNSTRLNGRVTDTGSEDPNVIIYWGDNDGETAPNNWDYPVPVGTKAAESFYADINGLSPNTPYYFRCYAENSAAGGWADSTTSFITLRPPSHIDFDPNELVFPVVNVGDYNDLTFDIKNASGDTMLQIESLSIVGLDQAVYSLVTPPTVPFDIPPLSSQSVTVRFAPGGAQSYDNAATSVGSDDPNQSVALLPLTGQGGPLAVATTSVVGSVGGDSHAVALRDQYAFVGQGATLTILDKSDPTDLQPVGQARLSDVIQSAVVVGDMVYIAAGASGLLPVQITNITSPEVLDACDTQGYAYDIASAGSTLCIADGLGGLSIFDISVPNAPNLQGVYNTQGSARAVELFGPIAYLLDDQLGLQLIDVSNPATPLLLSTCNGIEFGQAIAVDGDVCCITDSLGNFFVVDLYSPLFPYIYNQFRLTSGAGQAVSLSGVVAYVATGQGGLEIIDWLTPVSLGVYDTPGQASDMVVSGSLVYVADGTAGFRAIDVSSPSAPLEQGAYVLQSKPYSVAESNSLAYVARADTGLQVLDISSPASPSQQSSLETLLEGDIHTNNTVDFLDFSLLAQNWLQSGPLLAGDIYRDNTVDYFDLSRLVANWLKDGTLDAARSIVISGQFAYIANGSAGLQIADISDPSAPLPLGSYATEGYACSVAVSGSLALVADGTNVYVLDVSDSRSPLLDDMWVSSGRASGVAISGSYGYVADGDRGLVILDLSDPLDVTEAGSCETPGLAYGVAVVSGAAYVAGGLSGLQVLDVSTPSNPLPISTFDTPGTALNVVVAGAKAYIADGVFGLTVIDVSTPSTPTLYARSYVPVRSWSVIVSGSQIIVADDTGGLVMLTTE
jgi:hypothetical protein